MSTLIFSAIYFIFPAYIANMFPVFFGKLKLPGGYPISQRWLGAHKTWRGVYAGYIGAFIVLCIQKYIFLSGGLKSYSLLNYQEINLFFFAFLFGVGAITGDAVKSFFKRRLQKKPGAPWFPFDQVDFIFGAVLFVYPFYPLSFLYIIVLLIITPLLHFLTNLLGYFLKLKDVWW